MEKIALGLGQIIRSSGYQKEDIIFICIGSDRSVGDSLGPLVGTMLEEKQVPYRIYGTLEHPVHAFNLEGMLKEIKKSFKKPLIICVDACLGDQDQIGHVYLKDGPLVPGRALQKVLPQVGDYHIIGVVNYIDPLPSMQFLNDTRLYTVMNLAKTIVDIIVKAAD